MLTELEFPASLLRGSGSRDIHHNILGFPGGSAVKNPPANAGDEGSNSGSGRSPGGGHATHSSVLAWEIPGTEEPGGLQTRGLQRVRCDLGLRTTSTRRVCLAYEGSGVHPRFSSAWP